MDIVSLFCPLCLCGPDQCACSDLEALSPLEAQVWTQEVLAREGLEGWKVFLCSAGPGKCHHEPKEIWIYIKDKPLWRQREDILHEVAHALDGEKPVEEWHGPLFYRWYVHLLLKYCTGGPHA